MDGSGSSSSGDVSGEDSEPDTTMPTFCYKERREWVGKSLRVMLYRSSLCCVLSARQSATLQGSFRS